MTIAHDILAAPSGDLTQLVGLAILVFISMIIALIKKAAEKQQTPPTRRDAPSGTPPGTVQQPPPRSRGYQEAPTARRQPSQAEAAPRPAAPPVRPPVRTRVTEEVRRMAESMGIELEVEPAPPPPMPIPHHPTTPYQRVPQRKAVRATAHEAPPPAVPASHETVAQHHLHTRLTDRPGGPYGPAGLLYGIDLSTTETLRQAVVMYEIFSAPKALRQDGEKWQQ